jgi:hypothetical protein
MILVFSVISVSYAYNTTTGETLASDTIIVEENENDELIAELDDLSNQQNITPYDLVEATEYADVEVDQIDDNAVFVTITPDEPSEEIVYEDGSKTEVFEGIGIILLEESSDEIDDLLLVEQINDARVGDVVPIIEKPLAATTGVIKESKNDGNVALTLSIQYEKIINPNFTFTFVRVQKNTIPTIINTAYSGSSLTKLELKLRVSGSSISGPSDKKTVQRDNTISRTVTSPKSGTAYGVCSHPSDVPGYYVPIGDWGLINLTGKATYKKSGVTKTFSFSLNPW